MEYHNLQWYFSHKVRMCIVSKWWNDYVCVSSVENYEQLLYSHWKYGDDNGTKEGWDLQES